MTFTNLSHELPDDIDILLVGPTGVKVIVMSDAGSTLDLFGITLTLDDDAASSLPDTSQTLEPQRRGDGRQ